MVEIEIDGQKLEADHGAMVIEVADRADIYIPRFCYHKKLSIAANCRMCLVEVEGVGKTLPACATPVTDGMKVHTQSPKARQAQKIVMEFLLINHPLDCPVCDQGGQCELQDIAMGFGDGVSKYNQGKRSVADKDIGPLIQTEMTRCIHCTRCIRFGEEVAGVKELGMTGRGEASQVGTYVASLVRSEVSGNVIDLCPVGALNAKPSAKQGRSWHFTQHAGISLHDCLGTNVYWHTDEGSEQTSHAKVVQTVPRSNEAINESWIADRDRFSYQGLHHSDRITHPMIKKNGKWHQVSWHEALGQVQACFSKIMIEHGGGHFVGAVASPSASLESLYMFQKLFRGIGCPNIDHRCRRVDFSTQESDDLVPGLGLALAALAEQRTIWLVGCDIHREAPIAGLRVRQANLMGGSVFATQTLGYSYHFDLAGETIVDAQHLPQQLASVLVACYKVLGKRIPPAEKALLKEVEQDAESAEIAEALCQGEEVAIVMGQVSWSHIHYGLIQTILKRISELTGATLGLLTEGGNSAGAALLGVLPHRGVAGADVPKGGMDMQTMWHAPRKAYFLMGVEPEDDCINAGEAMAALRAAELVVVCGAYASETLRASADILLPAASVTEESGTYINAAGNQQTVRAATALLGEAKPTWKIMRVLGNLFDLPGFEQHSIECVRTAIAHETKEMNLSILAKQVFPKTWPKQMPGEFMQFYWPLNACDGIVRRAQALQQTSENESGIVRMNSESAKKRGVKEDEMVTLSDGINNIHCQVKIDESLPSKNILVPRGGRATSGFGLGPRLIKTQAGGSNV